MRQIVSCFVVLAIFALSSVTTLAQDSVSIGKIYGSIGDQDQKWIPIKMEGIGSTSTYDKVVPGLTSYSIQGHIGGVFNLENSVAISFDIMPNGSVIEPKIVYLDTGSIRSFFESDAGSIKIRLTKIDEINNGIVHLSGEIEGSLYHTKIEGISVNVEKTNTLDAFLYFETEVYPEQ